MLHKLHSVFLTAAFLTLPISALATQYRVVDQPRQECWNEQVATQVRGSDYGPALIGGVAGGLLGSTVGGGSGRNAATAIGAITGALSGDRLYSGQQGVAYQNVQRCRTVVDHVRVAVPEPARLYYQPAAMAAPVIVEPNYYVAPQLVYVEDWRTAEYRRQQWRQREWQRREWESRHEAEERREEWRERHHRH